MVTRDELLTLYLDDDALGKQHHRYYQLLLLQEQAEALREIRDALRDLKPMTQ